MSPSKNGTCFCILAGIPGSSWHRENNDRSPRVEDALSTWCCGKRKGFVYFFLAYHLFIYLLFCVQGGPSHTAEFMNSADKDHRLVPDHACCPSKPLTRGSHKHGRYSELCIKRYKNRRSFTQLAAEPSLRDVFIHVEQPFRLHCSGFIFIYEYFL